MTDNLKFEKRLRKKYRYVVGIDEAGRGPLFGPVIAASLFINDFSKIPREFFEKIKDSKKLSSKKREEAYILLKKNSNVFWGRGLVSAKVIDKINILEAVKLAMRRSVKNLEKKIGKKFNFKNTILIIDGNQSINSGFEEKLVVKADEKIFLCAAASIVSKVQRDNLMKKYDREYSSYALLKNKGYPTKEHKKNIRKHGLSKLHRQSFNCG